MTREVMLRNVPTVLKLSEVIIKMETFGEIVRVSMDEKRRKNSSQCHYFLVFSDHIFAQRAIAAGSVNINGKQLKIHASDTRNNYNGNKFNIIRDGKVTAIERNPDARSSPPPKKLKSVISGNFK